MGSSMFQFELMARIVLASILGICIGYERKSHNYFAGVKTHMIVCFSSALVMIVSKYAFEDMIDYDAARLAAQMISGVGFIGAGIILKHENMMIKGLTTAAGILGTCGIGLAVGSGMYIIGVFATVLFILLFKITNHFDILHQADMVHYSVKLSSTDTNQIVKKICEDSRVVSYQVNLDKEEKTTSIKLLCVFDTQQDKESWENLLLDEYEVIQLGKY